MLSFPSSGQLTLAIFVSVANAIVLLCCSLRCLHIFQLGGYRTRGFLTWLSDRKSKFHIRLFSLSALSFGSMFVVNILFYNPHFKGIEYLGYLGMIFYFYLALVFILDTNRVRTKISLKFTQRVKRLMLLMTFMFFILSYLAIWLGSMHSVIRFSLIAVIPSILPFLMLFCNSLLWPVEASIRAWYRIRARAKLRRAEYKHLIRIGVTGSWGKTSCKNILAKMLSKKYNVAASPSSFNTPMGFAKTVNNILDGHDVLIFEMGARYPRDIKYLCRLFKPRYGILTGIGPQHIDTMKRIDVIKRTKSDLVNSLPKQTGIAIINGDNEKCLEVFAELKLENKFVSSINETEKAEAWVEDLRVTSEGCTFKLFIKESKPVKCKTKLLGLHSIENILMCAILANKLGVEASEIASVIEELEPTPHRLELTKAENGVLILDDSYNASPGGTEAAMKVLSLFEGQKIVMTPGIVELGSFADEENFKFGVRMAKVADAVIIVNDINKAAISDGLLSQGFSEKNIYFAKTLQDAKEIYSGILKPGDILLIENDLPDNYM